MTEHGWLWASVLLSFTLLKAALAATLVIYPVRHRRKNLARERGTKTRKALS
jgi:hypothetical protein